MDTNGFILYYKQARSQKYNNMRAEYYRSFGKSDGFDDEFRKYVEQQPVDENGWPKVSMQSWHKYMDALWNAIKEVL